MLQRHDVFYVHLIDVVNCSVSIVMSLQPRELKFILKLHLVAYDVLLLDLKISIMDSQNSGKI